MKDLSTKNLIISIKEFFYLLLLSWKRLVLFCVIGSFVGFFIAISSPIKFQSKITFVVEESKSSSAGLASLAGQFGFDFGGAMGGGVFSGDNILLFLRSEELCREVLLTKYDSTNTTLADKYIEVSGLRKKWQKSLAVGDINFNSQDQKTFTRIQDSLLQKIVFSILKTDLFVGKPDKKSTFVQVVATMNDEMLSFLFSKRLVEIASQKYVQSKTKVKLANVNMLQRRADSLSSLLNAKTFFTASAQQELVDVNPAIRTSTIQTEISGREKNMIATIFAEVVKNLEISRTMLSQETPAIQLVDKSYLPLKRSNANFIWYSVFGGFLFVFLYILFLFIRKWIESVMR